MTPTTIPARELTAAHDGRRVRIDGNLWHLIASQRDKHGVLLAVQDATGKHQPKRVDLDTPIEVVQ